MIERLQRMLLWKPSRKRLEKGRLVYKDPSVQDSGEEAIPLAWWWPWRGQVNFGDALSPLLVRALSGKKVRGCFRRTAQDDDPALLAIGSILHASRDRDWIWGSGLNYKEEFFKTNCFRPKELLITAVRGPLTRKFLVEKGMICPEVYGDPAMLMPYIFKGPTSKKYDVGFLPHFNDRFNYAEVLRRTPLKAQIISASDFPLSVIKKICECRVIVATSLHGIILAEAYGVPACWAYSEEAPWNGRPEMRFKYEDYYLSTGREPAAYTYHKELIVGEAIEHALKIKKPVFNANELLLAFPLLRPGIKSLEDLGRYEIKGLNYAFDADFWRSR